MGQVRPTNDYFPLGSLSQYAAGRDPNGTVQKTYLVANTTSGERVRVPLSKDGVGLQRAEIEGHLRRILDDPSLLQGIANGWARLHPDKERYTRVSLMLDMYRLVDGRPSGKISTRQLATWEVRR